MYGKRRVSHLLQVLSVGLLMDDIEQRPGTEETSHMSTNGLVSECGIRIVDLDGLSTTASGRSISEQLRVA